MDERLKFIARLLDGEKMSVLCREFGISRKTGYKLRERYQDFGVAGLTDRSRRPYRQANQLPLPVEKTIVRLKQDRPSWGAPKACARPDRVSERLCGGAIPMRLHPRSARCMRCSTVMA